MHKDETKLKDPLSKLFDCKTSREMSTKSSELQKAAVSIDRETRVKANYSSHGAGRECGKRRGGTGRFCTGRAEQGRVGVGFSRFDTADGRIFYCTLCQGCAKKLRA